MVKIIFRYKQLERALSTLHDSIDLETSGEHFSEKAVIALRDSKIQRFEYCAELLWKVLREYLEENVGKPVPVARPKDVLREALTVNFLSQKEFDICVRMIDDRNRASHMYDEKTAQEIDTNIQGYYRIMLTICKRMKP